MWSNPIIFTYTSYSYQMLWKYTLLKAYARIIIMIITSNVPFIVGSIVLQIYKTKQKTFFVVAYILFKVSIYSWKAT